MEDKRQKKKNRSGAEKKRCRKARLQAAMAVDGKPTATESTQNFTNEAKPTDEQPYELKNYLSPLRGFQPIHDSAREAMQHECLLHSENRLHSHPKSDNISDDVNSTTRRQKKKSRSGAEKKRCRKARLQAAMAVDGKPTATESTQNFTKMAKQDESLSYREKGLQPSPRNCQSSREVNHLQSRFTSRVQHVSLKPSHHSSKTTKQKDRIDSLPKDDRFSGQVYSYSSSSPEYSTEDVEEHQYPIFYENDTIKKAEQRQYPPYEKDILLPSNKHFLFESSAKYGEQNQYPHFGREFRPPSNSEPFAREVFQGPSTSRMDHFSFKSPLQKTEQYQNPYLEKYQQSLARNEYFPQDIDHFQGSPTSGESDSLSDIEAASIISNPKTLENAFPFYTNVEEMELSCNRSLPDIVCHTSKKAKQEHNLAISKEIQHNLKVAIINNDHPLGHIPENKVDLVKKVLQRELDKLIFSASSSNSNFAPAFESWVYSGKVIEISCVDHNTSIWLTKTVSTIMPWENASLSVVSSDRLQKLTKASLFIPKEAMVCGLEDKTVVLQRLARQNPEVNVEKWSLFRHANTPKGQIFVFGIGDHDMKILIEKLLKVFYLFQSLHLKVKLSNLVEQVVDEVMSTAGGNYEPLSDSSY